jgi:anti-sigma factor RsiW
MSEMLDVTLQEELLQELFRHLADCAGCRTYFVHTNAIRNAVRSLPYESAPDILNAKFDVLTIGAEHRFLKERTVSISFPSVLYSVGAAILMGLFIYTVGIFQERNMSMHYQQSVEQFRHAVSESTVHHQPL